MPSACRFVILAAVNETRSQVLLGTDESQGAEGSPTHVRVGPGSLDVIPAGMPRSPAEATCPHGCYVADEAPSERFYTRHRAAGDDQCDTSAFLRRAALRRRTREPGDTRRAAKKLKPETVHRRLVEWAEPAQAESLCRDDVFRHLHRWRRVLSRIGRGAMTVIVTPTGQIEIAKQMTLSVVRAENVDAAMAGTKRPGGSHDGA